ncbi:MAG TPA: methyltransferase [Planctomycetaceae bacterium]|nr:methyltransferase [Planctomycetaceae bacterium]
MDISSEASVYGRYAAAAQQFEPALCCPVEYRKELLEAIPQEILERDYGCGDPTPFVRQGDTVLDLGSGGGKLCYIAAQVVGQQGRVIGVDCNAEMLALARKHQDTVAQRIGYRNVEFRYGLIQDLQLDLDRLQAELRSSPITGVSDYIALRSLEDQLRMQHPLIESESIDCVLSNCVLNLVRQVDRRRLFDEIFRVLKTGGRAAISDIVSDETVPEHLRRDSTLWSGCISGSFREDEFLHAFEDAGFHGIEIAKRSQDPWQTVEGIEFRSITVVAYKGKQGPCLERNQAVIYRGPFKHVADDDGHIYYRGKRMAVCDKTFGLLQRKPYDGMFEAIHPRETIAIEDAKEFDCRKMRYRDPRQSKGYDYDVTTEVMHDCDDGEPCC